MFVRLIQWSNTLQPPRQEILPPQITDHSYSSLFFPLSLCQTRPFYATLWWGHKADGYLSFPPTQPSDLCTFYYQGIICELLYPVCDRVFFWLCFFCHHQLSAQFGRSSTRAIGVFSGQWLTTIWLGCLLWCGLEAHKTGRRCAGNYFVDRNQYPIQRVIS